MTPVALFIFLLSACNGCRPHISTDNNNTRVDTNTLDDTQETGETGETADTGPTLPDRCDAMEVESNDSIDLSEPFAMEKWLCGTFLGDTALGDPEFLNFTTTDPGWVTVKMEAAARNSSADPQFFIYDDAGHSVLMYDGVATSDPTITIPTDHAGIFGLVLAETGYLTGDAYTWALLATQDKPPVDWTFEETEDNDAQERANTFVLGETVFAKMQDTADKDWFHVSVPEGLQSVTFNVEGFGSGSPVDLMLHVYEADTLKKACYHGVVDYDLDPDCELKVTSAHEWDVEIEDETDSGSTFNWYVLTIAGVAE